MFVEMDNGDNSPTMAHPLIINARVSIQCLLCGLFHRGFFCVLGNDFSSLCFVSKFPWEE